MRLFGKTKNRWFRHRGMALVVILSLVAILGMMTGVVGRQAGLALAANQQRNEKDVAHYIAYGGMQRTLIYLRNDPAYPGGNGKKFPGTKGAKYSVQVIENTDPVNPMTTAIGVDLPPLAKLVVCKGESGDSSETLAGILGSGAPSSGFGALAKSRVALDGGLVDAFSANGSFALADIVQEPGAAQIGTDGGFTELRKKHDGTPAVLDGDVASDSVDGDVTTTEGGVYSLDATATVAGETQLTSPPALDPPTLVTYNGGPTIDVAAGGTKTLTPGHYKDFQASFDGNVTLEPGDYYFSGNFEMHDTAKLKVNGAVKIHVDKLFVMRDHSTINRESDPSNVEIQVTGSHQANYPWLWNSRAHSNIGGWSPTGPPGKGSTGDEAEIWGKVRVTEASFFNSGSVYGDVQADTITVHGDATRHSGAIHFYTGFASNSGTPNPPAVGGNLVYDSIWVVH